MQSNKANQYLLFDHHIQSKASKSTCKSTMELCPSNSVFVRAGSDNKDFICSCLKTNQQNKKLQETHSLIFANLNTAGRNSILLQFLVLDFYRMKEYRLVYLSVRINFALYERSVSISFDVSLGYVDLNIFIYRTFDVQAQTCFSAKTLCDKYNLQGTSLKQRIIVTKRKNEMAVNILKFVLPAEKVLQFGLQTSDEPRCYTEHDILNLPTERTLKYLISNQSKETTYSLATILRITKDNFDTILEISLESINIFYNVMRGNFGFIDVFQANIKPVQSALNIHPSLCLPSCNNTNLGTVNAYSRGLSVYDHRECPSDVGESNGKLLNLTLLLSMIQKHCYLMKCVISVCFFVFQGKQKEEKDCSFLLTTCLRDNEKKGKEEINKDIAMHSEKNKNLETRFENELIHNISKLHDRWKIINSPVARYDSSYWVYPVTNHKFLDMENELHRLGTFHSFPDDNCPSFIKMAQSGFFYTGEQRSTVCFSCKITYNNWSSYTKPIELHRALSMQCSYLISRFPIVQTTPIDKNQPGNIIKELTYQPCIDYERIKTNGASSVSKRGSVNDEQNETLCPRSRMYQSSSNDMHNSTLARRTDSGYGSDLYLNKQSNCKNDIQTDNRSNELPGISEDYQSRISSLRTGSQNVFSNNNTRQPPPKYPEYQLTERRRVTYKAWPDLHFLHPLDLSECGFFYANFSDCVRCYQCGIGLRNWDSDDNPWVEHARWSRKCTYLIQKKGQNFIDTVLNVLGIQTDSQREESSRTSSEHLLQQQGQVLKDAEIVQNKKTDSTHSVAKTVIQEKKIDENLVEHGLDDLRKHTDVDSEKVQQENKELKELYTCKICLDEKVGITFVPCGHLVTCKTCSPKIRRCPLCRTFIRGTIKTTV